MFDFDVSEKGGITEIRFTAWTDVVSAVWIVSASSSASGHVWMLDTGGKH